MFIILLRICARVVFVLRAIDRPPTHELWRPVNQYLMYLLDIITRVLVFKYNSTYSGLTANNQTNGVGGPVVVSVSKLKWRLATVRRQT